MLWFLRLVLLWMLPRFGRDPDKLRDLMLECFSLRQQNAVLLRHGRKVRLSIDDRAFWILLRRVWAQWKTVCLLVKPATVIQWHRAGFRIFWRWQCRPKGRPGRPSVSLERRALIRRLVQENPFWGAPRVHGELLKLGFRLSERSVQRWMPKRSSDPKRAQNWRAFLENHREVIAAMDFLVVPTWNFGRLYVLVILQHGRRVIAHINATRNPTAAWVKQQLREAFPYGEIPKYLLFDNDTTFGAVKDFVATMGIIPKQTSFHSPWQNGTCERVIGTLRRDLLDHAIVLDESHLRRLLRTYLHYYHSDRTHLGLDKDSPSGRLVDSRTDASSQVMALPRCGGLHHRYVWEHAA
jgi:putative transposase